MATDAEVEKFRNIYKDKTDEELIHLMGQYVSHSEMHIAAKQLLHSRQRKIEKENEEYAANRHSEALEQERVLHRKTQQVAWYAFWAAVVGVLIAGATLIYNIYK
jgi:hypothetical protein